MYYIKKYKKGHTQYITKTQTASSFDLDLDL